MVALAPSILLNERVAGTLKIGTIAVRADRPLALGVVVEVFVVRDEGNALLTKPNDSSMVEVETPKET
jgi:hypothetical protein